MKPSSLLASFAGLASLGFAQVQINEIRIDQPGADNDEFMELVGTPGASLDGLTYIVIGDGPSALGSGVIERVIDLSGFALDANGLFLAANALIAAPAVPDLVLPANAFENSDNVTHLLVADFTGANGDDLDLDDDGVLDITPWTAVVSGIALLEETNMPPLNTEWAYPNLPNTVGVGPDGNFVPGHVFRCDDGVRIGQFATGAATETPGAPNFCPAVTEVFCAPGIANSTGAASQVSLESASGGSIAANDASLVVTGTPDELGLFAQSMSTIAPVTLATGGNLCLGFPDIQRLGDPIVAMNNTASLQLDFANGGFEVLTMSGVTMYYQWYHRDATVAPGANFSEGLAVTWID